MLDVTAQYGLRPFVLFNHVVSEARFDEATAKWHIKTESGQTVIARHFIMATGPLHVPSIPKIPGLENFKGKFFHSAQWDHSYDLRGKNVVSIGTGGSAIQYIPEIAPQVKQLYVFQRTPAWVIPRDERGYSSVEKTLFARIPLLRQLHRARLYWSNESRLLPILNAGVAKQLQTLAKLFIRFQVKNKETARKLTPDYTIGCKRILISNKYFPTFNRPNVELVTEGIQEVREHSIITKDGVERPVDCIILGTGFVVDPRIYLRDFPVIGRDGHDLRQDWKETSQGYYGSQVAGYPNFFQLVGPNTGLGHNSIIFMIEAQAHYIVECLKLKNQKKVDSIDIRQEIQDAFNQRIQKGFNDTVWTSGCNSWYQNSDGGNFALWPHSTWKFWLETRKINPQNYVLKKANNVEDLIAVKRQKTSA
jgi:cation diffusion facilitator CzcD-associated flavoprotein CzcO